MMLRVSVTAILLLLSASVQAQTKTAAPKPTFEEALLKARMPLVLADGRYSGEGAAVLGAAVAESRFVLLGEDHVTREIPQFTSALCDLMHPDAYAVEAGPSAARFVNGVLRDPGRIAKTAARNRTDPNSMAFLDVREENDLAAHCAGSSNNPRFVVWGLDQEFLGSSATLLREMAATKPGPRSRAAIAEMLSKSDAAAAQAKSTGDFSKLFLLASTDTEVKALADAVAADGNGATRDVLHEFTLSREIYHLNDQGSPDSNLLRGQLLKQHFLREYLALKQRMPAPRVLFKFGDNHTGKGFNYTHELNLGNFVAETAAGENARSLHILVLGARGMHFSIAGYGKPLGQQPFVMADDPDYKWVGVAAAQMLPLSASGGSTLTMFDLRKLRYHRLEMPPQWEHVVYSYDLFVLLPELSVASVVE